MYNNAMYIWFTEFIKDKIPITIYMHKYYVYV